MTIELWAPENNYTTIGKRIEYQTAIFELIQPHTSQWGWEPTQAPTLWKMIKKGNKYGQGYQSQNKFIKEKSSTIKDSKLPYEWKNYNGTISKKAYGESNRKDNTYYIARVNYNGGIHVGYLDPEKHACIISFNGKEVEIHEKIEILECKKSDVYWINCKNIPIINEGTPVIGGRERNGTELFVAKVIYNDICYFGKVSRKLNGIHFGLKGDEINEKCYQVLVFDRKV